MNYYNKDIKHVRGDTLSIAFIVEESYQELNSATFTCKENLNDEADVLFSKTLDNGISLIEYIEEDDIRKYAVRIAPEDTEDLQSGTYEYDLELGINGDIFTIMKGKFIIEQDCAKGGN